MVSERSFHMHWALYCSRPRYGAHSTSGVIQETICERKLAGKCVLSALVSLTSDTSQFCTINEPPDAAPFVSTSITVLVLVDLSVVAGLQDRIAAMRKVLGAETTVPFRETTWSCVYQTHNRGELGSTCAWAVFSCGGLVRSWGCASRGVAMSPSARSPMNIMSSGSSMNPPPHAHNASKTDHTCTNKKLPFRIIIITSRCWVAPFWVGAGV